MLPRQAWLECQGSTEVELSIDETEMTLMVPRTGIGVAVASQGFSTTTDCDSREA